MPTVKFTKALKRFYPDLQALESSATDIKLILQELEDQFPGFSSYIVDDQGRLRKHVNIFVDGKMIQDREGLSDSLDQVREIYIMQALSGG